MTCISSVAAAVSKSTRTFRCFTDFRGDGGSLALGRLQKVSFTNRGVVLCRKNGKIWPFRGKLLAVGAQMSAKNNKVSLLWAAAANVTNASFKPAIQYPCKYHY